MAGFWGAQYVLGIGAIIAIHMNVPHLPVLLVVASCFCTAVGAKLLGIGPELQKEANEQVPRFVRWVWKIVFLFVVIVLAANTRKITTIAGFHIPMTSAQALILLYSTAALNDSFLMRFYFSRELRLA